MTQGSPCMREVARHGRRGLFLLGAGLVRCHATLF
jgi:hypothetical protein